MLIRIIHSTHVRKDCTAEWFLFFSWFPFLGRPKCPDASVFTYMSNHQIRPFIFPLLLIRYLHPAAFEPIEDEPQFVLCLV